MGQYLIDSCINCKIKIKYVYGLYAYDSFENKFGHTWLFVDDSYIVDITADQKQFSNLNIFPQNAYMPCFVGERSEFHLLFEIIPTGCYDFYGMKCKNRSRNEYMYNLYDIIVLNIEE